MSDSSKDEKLQELEEEKRKIYNRMKEVRELMQTTTSSDERRRQSERLKILRDMYRNLVDQIEMIRPPEEKRHKAPPRRMISSAAAGFDFFERCGSVWSDIEGRTWNEFSEIIESGSANQAAVLMRALSSAMLSLTERQTQFIIEYYSMGKKMTDIAADANITKSTVSRTIHRGLERIESYIIASLKVREHLGDDGFDFMGFANSTDVLTERQREMLYFLLTDKTSMLEIADYLTLCKSTVSRSWQRICDNLANVRTDIPDAPSATKIAKHDWINSSEKEIAERLGISPAVYFRNICRYEKVGPYSRYVYEVLRLRGRKNTVEAAEFLGVSPCTVSKYWRMYPDFDPDEFPAPEPYSPARIREDKSINIRRLLYEATPSSGYTIGDSIDSETYRKLQEVSRRANT